MKSAKEAREAVERIEERNINELLSYIEGQIDEACNHQKYATGAIDWSHLTGNSRKHIREALIGLGYIIESTEEKLLVRW